MKSIYTLSIIILALLCNACSNDNPLYINDSISRHLAISPLNSNLNIGTTGQYSALLIAEDGSQVDVTTQARWQTDDALRATINNEGVAQAVGEGDVVVSASYDGLEATAILFVTSKTLQSLIVTPTQTITLAGLTSQFYSIAMFDDGTSQDVTRDTQWISGDTAVASIGVGTGLVSAIMTGGPVVITASFALQSSNASIEVINASVTAMQLDPANAVLPVSNLQQYRASILLNTTPVETIDVTEDVSWSISNGLVASIGNQDYNRGLLQARTPGVSSVTATLIYAGTTTSSSATVEVTPIVLESIQVSPANPTVIRGTIGQFQAIGFYSDGSERNITLSAIWASSNTAIGTVEATGQQSGEAYAINPGRTNISASLLGISGSTGATVTAPDLESISIIPDSPSIPIGLRQVFSATGYFSDDTAQDISKVVSWSSSDNNVAELNPRLPGSVETLSTGSTIITASLDEINGSTDLTVTSPSLVSISISPEQYDLPRNLDFNYNAYGTYSNSIVADITASVIWLSSDTSITTISNGAGNEGRAHTLAAGSTNITAEDVGSGLSASTTLTVSSGYTTFITPSCSPLTIAVGEVSQCSCVGHVSNSDETYDCNPLAIFTPQPAGYVLFSTTTGEEGQAIGINIGTSNIYIKAGNSASNTTVIVE